MFRTSCEKLSGRALCLTFTGHWDLSLELNNKRKRNKTKNINIQPTPISFRSKFQEWAHKFSLNTPRGVCVGGCGCGCVCVLLVGRSDSDAPWSLRAVTSGYGFGTRQAASACCFSKDTIRYLGLCSFWYFWKQWKITCLYTQVLYFAQPLLTNYCNQLQKKW